METLASGRIASLDLVRGIAVMGILTMNIVAFAMPFPAYDNPAAYGGDTGLDLASWFGNFVLFDGKMRALFSMLFGASTLLVIDRASAAGHGVARAHYARMAVLLLLGCLHFWFLWFGDILALYAISGMVLYLFRNLSPKALLGWAIGLMTLSALFYGLIAGTAALAGSPLLPPRAASELYEARRTVEHEVGAKSPKIEKELKLYSGPYGPILDHRLVERTTEPVASFLAFGLETVGLMLVGMALFRTGFLTGQWSRERYRRWAIGCSLLGIPPLVLLAAWVVRSGFDPPLVFGAFITLSLPFDILLAIAWAAAVMLWLQSSGAEALKARIAAAGRMAFTNYIATSVVMTTLFYGYGFGLFGDVSRAGLWIPVLGMWALMLAWSKPWLDRFRYGPLEWLWRSLARGSV